MPELYRATGMRRWSRNGLGGNPDATISSDSVDGDVDVDCPMHKGKGMVS